MFVENEYSIFVFAFVLAFCLLLKKKYFPIYIASELLPMFYSNLNSDDVLKLKIRKKQCFPKLCNIKKFLLS